MKLLALLATYLAVTASLFGGLVGGVLWVVKPDPTATAAPRVAPISPRIADSIERKKMDAPAPTPVVQTTGTTVAPEPIQPVMQGAPAALTHAPQIHIRELNERIAKRKAPRQERNVAQQAPALAPEIPAARPIATVRTDFPY